MIFSSRKGFTLVEIITVVVIFGVLFSALYIWSQPYMKRSRDTRRITEIGSYMNIIDAYNANFDTFPSNEGSGWSLIPGYCLSEMYTRPNYVGFKDKQFETIWSGSSVPPSDPTRLAPIPPCDMTGSYLYSKMNYGTDRQIAIIAARLEIRETANYGTGADLISSWAIMNILAAKRWSVSPTDPDALYVVTKTR